jgi:hypothetical protein
MGFKVQRKNAAGQLLDKQDIPEAKVRELLPEAVIREMKLGRYVGDKNIREFAVYTYERDDILKR